MQLYTYVHVRVRAFVQAGTLAEKLAETWGNPCARAFMYTHVDTRVYVRVRISVQGRRQNI